MAEQNWLVRKFRYIARTLPVVARSRSHHIWDLGKSWVIRQRQPLHDGMPWISWPCIDWLERTLRPGMRVLEYGGGGSTIFFLRHGCDVTTIEGDAKWVDAIQKRAGPLVPRLTLRYVNNQSGDPAMRAVYANQGAIGGPWDLILIDGAWREDCAEVAKRNLAPGGFIIVDNTDLPEHAGIYRLMEGYRRTIFSGLGYARRELTTTELFERI